MVAEATPAPQEVHQVTRQLAERLGAGQHPPGTRQNLNEITQRHPEVRERATQYDATSAEGRLMSFLREGGNLNERQVAEYQQVRQAEMAVGAEILTAMGITEDMTDEQIDQLPLTHEQRARINGLRHHLHGPFGLRARGIRALRRVVGSWQSPQHLAAPESHMVPQDEMQARTLLQNEVTPEISERGSASVDLTQIDQDGVRSHGIESLPIVMERFSALTPEESQAFQRELGITTNEKGERVVTPNSPYDHFVQADEQYARVHRAYVEAVRAAMPPNGDPRLAERAYALGLANIHARQIRDSAWLTIQGQYNVIVQPRLRAAQRQVAVLQGRVRTQEALAREAERQGSVGRFIGKVPQLAGLGANMLRIFVGAPTRPEVPESAWVARSRAEAEAAAAPHREQVAQLSSQITGARELIAELQQPNQPAPTISAGGANQQ